MFSTTYSTVIGDNDRARIEAYLYSHTSIVATATVGRLTAYLLATIVDGVEAKPEAERLTKYQCDRLASGCYSTPLVAGTATEAANAVKQFVSAGIERT